MNKNFRSRKEVLEDINIIFSRIMTLSLGGADYKKDHIIEYGLEDYQKGDNEKQNNHGEFITYSKEDTTSPSEYEARIICEDIIKKINEKYTVFKPGNAELKIEPTSRPCEFKDFAVLIDRATDFETYKKVFTEYQIPLYVEQDENITKNVITKLLKNLLVVINAIKKNEFKEDYNFSLISLARSFIFEMDDEKIYDISLNKKFIDNEVYFKIDSIIKENRGLSDYELLKCVLFQLDVYHKLCLIGNVEINSLYLDKFSEYFASMGKLDYSIEDFISFIDNISEYNLKITIPTSGANLNSCKIMTIHKSKGLEFPIVYFSGLSNNFNMFDSRGDIGIKMEYGIRFKEEDTSVIKTLSSFKTRHDDLSEKIRLLYVALTRTREKMIFLMQNEIKEVELEKAKSFGEILKPLMKEFTVREYVPLSNYSFKKDTKKVEHIAFINKNIEFKRNIITHHHASKGLKLNSSKYILEYGTYLHELMEVFDFKNPDYSIIENDKIKSLVKNFVESNLLKNVQEGKIFKGYEFIDNDNQGIIDLYIVYDDHVDLIDYKTKNIDDSKYDEQLEMYRAYLKKRYERRVDAYLYSLVDSNYRKVGE